MPNNIQTIIDKYDDIFGEKHHQICIGKNCECHKEVKQFLKDSLTSMLDGIEKELPKETPQEVIDRQMYCVALRSQGENTYRQEAINIINSHK